MKPSEHFNFCPKCGAPRGSSRVEPAYQCHACGFVYYFNPAIAAAAFILNPKREVLVIHRAKEPAKGKLALPGGFIDFGETAEDALRREVREEVNLKLAEVTYLCSQPNAYPYKGITYPVLDFFFVAKPLDAAAVQALEDVAHWEWRVVDDRLDLQELAFDSLRAAFKVFRAKELA